MKLIAMAQMESSIAFLTNQSENKMKAQVNFLIKIELCTSNK